MCVVVMWWCGDVIFPPPPHIALHLHYCPLTTSNIKGRFKRLLIIMEFAMNNINCIFPGLPVQAISRFKISRLTGKYTQHVNESERWPDIEFALNNCNFGGKYQHSVYCVISKTYINISNIILIFTDTTQMLAVAAFWFLQLAVTDLWLYSQL